MLLYSPPLLLYIEHAYYSTCLADVKQLSVISYQLSVTSYQLSVTSYQLSVIGYQLSVNSLVRYAVAWIVFEDGQIHLAVVIHEKDVLTVVAPVSNMMRDVGYCDACGSRHTRRLFRLRPGCQWI